MRKVSIPVKHPEVGSFRIEAPLDHFLESAYIIPVETGSFLCTLSPGVLHDFGIISPITSTFSVCYIVKLYLSDSYIGTDSNKGQPVCIVLDADKLTEWAKNDTKHSSKSGARSDRRHQHKG